MKEKFNKTADRGRMTRLVRPVWFLAFQNSEGVITPMELINLNRATPVDLENWVDGVRDRLMAMISDQSSGLSLDDREVPIDQE